MGEPGFTSVDSLHPLDHDGKGPQLNFKFCDELPWDFAKAKRNGISEDFVSYMTYLLQPFADNMKHVSEDNKKSLQREYDRLLSSVGNDIYKLLNLMTKNCSDYLKFGTCNDTFQKPHYGIGGKCFPTKVSRFTGVGGCELFFFDSARRTKKINFNIASEIADEYNNIMIYIYDETKNIHLLNYDDLTPLRNQTYNMAKVKKMKYVRSKQARLIDWQTCRQSNYKHEDCVREINKIIFLT